MARAWKSAALLVRAAILTEDGLKGKACLVDRIGITNDELRITNVAQVVSIDSDAESRNNLLIQAIGIDEMPLMDVTPTENVSNRPDG